MACEGLPALVSYQLGSSSKAAKVIPLEGNVLDLAFIDTAKGPIAVVSIDHIHAGGSTSVVRSSPVSHHLGSLQSRLTHPS